MKRKMKRSQRTHLLIRKHRNQRVELSRLQKSSRRAGKTPMSNQRKRKRRKKKKQPQNPNSCPTIIWIKLSCSPRRILMALRLFMRT
jgi:hypothetical protein